MLMVLQMHIFNMYGGAIISNGEEALSLRPNNDTASVTAYIQNGYIRGWDAIFIQQGSANKVRTVNLTIDNGTFIGDLAPIRVYESAISNIQNNKFITITLNGGTFIEGEATLKYGAITVRNTEFNVTGWEVVNVIDNR